MKQQLGVAAPVIYPLSVYVIGTFDADGKANAMNAAWGIQCDYKKVTKDNAQEILDSLK